MDALKRANDVRVKRAKLKKDLKEGKVRIEQILGSPPEYVSTVSPKLRGGLYVQAVLPGSPAADAAIQTGDILLGMKVGGRHWETIRPDNILYVLRQPETAQTQSALLYVVRRNGIQPRRISLGGSLSQSVLSR